MSSVAQKLFNRVTNLSFAFVLALSSLTALAPFIFMRDAGAVGETEVTRNELQGWEQYGPGELEFVVDADAPIGNGALKISTTATGNYAQLDRIIPTAQVVSASDINVSYSTKRLAGAAHASPAFVLGIDKDGNLETEDLFYAWFEPVYNNSEAKDYNKWNNWNVNASSFFWFNGDKPAEAVTYTQTLNSVLVNLPNAKVASYTINQGSGNDGWVTLTDNVRTPQGAYDFEPSAIPLPQNVHLEHNGAPLSSGSTVSYTDGIKAVWDTIATPARYRITATHPDKTTTNFQPSTSNTWNPASITWNPSDAERQGFFGAEPGDKGEGEYSYTVAVQVNGSWSSESAPITLTYDNTAPTVTISQPASDGVKVKNSTNVVVTGTDTLELKSVTAHLYDSAGNQIPSVWQHPNVDGPSKTLTLPLTGLADGDYKLKAAATDESGKSVYATRNFTIDSTPPTIPYINNLDAGAFFNAIPILNSWSASTDDSGVAGYQIAYHYDDGHPFGKTTCPDVTIDGYSGFIGCRDVNVTQRNHTPGTTEQGGVTIWVRAKDNVGNYSDWSEPVHYYYDATAPTGGITYSTSQPTNGPVIITLTTSEPIEKPDGWTRVDDNTYTLTVSSNTIGTVTFTDLAGNSGGELSYKVTQIDTSAPDTTIADSTQMTNTPTISGTVDDVNSTVTLTVVGVGTFTLTPDTLGNWSQTVGPLAYGSYDIEVYATDQVENVGETDIALLTLKTTQAVVPDGDNGDIEGETDEVDGNNEGSENDGEQEPQTVANVTPIIFPPSANSDQAVQGATTENDQAVEGTNTENVAQVDTDASDGSIFGLAWYWWILILAGLTALVWGIIAALRRRQEEA